MTTQALELSNLLSAAVARAARSVVRVDARRVPSSGIVWSADGVIVTASHAIEDEEDVAIGFQDGTTTAATVAGRDHDTDVAVLRVDGAVLAKKGLLVPEWREATGLAPGQLVLAVSRPGRSPRASFGVLATVGEAWRTSSGGRIDHWLEADLGLYPGFSGSVLVDAEGRALGLDTSGLARGRALAIPATTLRRVVASLLSHGQVRRGYLGVATLPVGLADGEGGLLLSSIEPGSPAEGSGLLLGDVLVSFDGKPVRSAPDLLALLDEERIGRESPARVLRAGKVHDVQVKVGERS